MGAGYGAGRRVPGRADVALGDASDRLGGSLGEELGTGRPQAHDDDRGHRQNLYPLGGGAIGKVVGVWPAGA